MAFEQDRLAVIVSRENLFRRAKRTGAIITIMKHNINTPPFERRQEFLPFWRPAGNATEGGGGVN